METLIIIALNLLTILAWLWAIKIGFAWCLTFESRACPRSSQAHASELAHLPVPRASFAHAPRTAARLVAAK